MEFAIHNVELPVRLRLSRPMSDEELMRFCAQNEALRVEREANGELMLMSPTGSEGGRIDTKVTVELAIWARQDGRGEALGPSAGFTLPDGSVRAANAHWVSWQNWNALTTDQQNGLRRSARSS